MKPKIAALMFVLFTTALVLNLFVACTTDSDDDDDDSGVTCRELYDASMARHCMDYDTFEWHACTPDEPLTDDECFLECIEDLQDGDELCYDVEQCTIQCDEDDATGCENMYYGMENQECIDYKEFYMLACDPRVDLDYRNCVSFCYENEEGGCDDFWDCVEACDEE